MGRSLIFLFCLGISFSVSAQMTDLLGGLAVQGQITANGVKGFNTANLMLQKNNLAQELQLQLIEFKENLLKSNPNVSRETIASPLLKKYSTTLQKSGNLIYFELHNVEEKLCNSLTNGFAESYKIDTKNCQSVKIYYKQP